MAESWRKVLINSARTIESNIVDEDQTYRKFGGWSEG